MTRAFGRFQRTNSRALRGCRQSATLHRITTICSKQSGVSHSMTTTAMSFARAAGCSAPPSAQSAGLPTHGIERHEQRRIDFLVRFIGRVEKDALVGVLFARQERVQMEAETAEGWRAGEGTRSFRNWRAQQERDKCGGVAGPGESVQEDEQASESDSQVGEVGKKKEGLISTRKERGE